MSNLKIKCLGATFYVLGIRKKDVSVVSHISPTWRYFWVSRRTIRTQSNVCKFSTKCLQSCIAGCINFENQHVICKIQPKLFFSVGRSRKFLFSTRNNYRSFGVLVGSGLRASTSSSMILNTTGSCIGSCISPPINTTAVAFACQRKYNPSHVVAL